LWHGAAWTFVLWGVYFGVLQVGYNALRPCCERYVRPVTTLGRRAVKIGSILLMFNVMAFNTLFFRAENLGHVREVTLALFRGFAPTAATGRAALTFLFLGAPVVLMQIAQYRSDDVLSFLGRRSMVRFAGYLTAVYMVVLVYFFGAQIRGGEEFIYFQF